MKQIFYLGLALFFATVNSFAQEEAGKKALYIHSWLGVNAPNFSDLNSVLEGAGHVAPPQVLFARGGGLYAFYNNTRLVQFLNFATYTGSREEGIKRTWARGTQIGTALGVDLRRRTRLQAIPYAGVAYSMFGLRLRNAAGGSDAFGGYLSNGGNQHFINKNQWLANLGLHVGASPVGKEGFARKLDLALRAGYYLPLAQGKWKTDDVKLAGGPDVNTGGFYAGLVLGIRQ